VVAKKVAVSLTRRAAVSLLKVPVRAMGRAEYLLRKVATNAPRIANGARWAVALRSSRAPSRTRSMSTQSGVASMSAIKARSSGGASATASTPCSQAAVSMSISRRKP
jgi:hypothetical protein